MPPRGRGRGRGRGKDLTLPAWMQEGQVDDKSLSTNNYTNTEDVNQNVGVNAVVASESQPTRRGRGRGVSVLPAWMTEEGATTNTNNNNVEVDNKDDNTNTNTNTTATNESSTERNGEIAPFAQVPSQSQAAPMSGRGRGVSVLPSWMTEGEGLATAAVPAAPLLAESGFAPPPVVPGAPDRFAAPPLPPSIPGMEALAPAPASTGTIDTDSRKNTREEYEHEISDGNPRKRRVTDSDYNGNGNSHGYSSGVSSKSARYRDDEDLFKVPSYAVSNNNKRDAHGSNSSTTISVNTGTSVDGQSKYRRVMVAGANPIQPGQILKSSTNSGSTLNIHNANFEVDDSTRSGRRIYVGNIPANIQHKELGDFIREAMSKSIAKHQLLHQPQEMLHSVFVNHEKRYGFVELTTLEYATALVKLNQMPCQGLSLNIKRANDYNPSQAQLEKFTLDVDITKVGLGGDNNSQYGGGSSAMAPVRSSNASASTPDGPYKIFIGGLPHHLQAEQVMQLLLPFGPLKAFHLVKEAGAHNNKGYAFCEFENPVEVSPRAITGLNGVPIGERPLTVNYACGNAPITAENPFPIPAVLVTAGGVSAQPQSYGQMNQSEMLQSALAGAFSGANQNYSAYPSTNTGNSSGGSNPQVMSLQRQLLEKVPSRVVRLGNMVTMEELTDDEEWADIAQDVLDTCIGTEKHEVLSVTIPRVKEGFSYDLQGDIYVEFKLATAAQAAAVKLCGKKFGGNIVSADFHDENTYRQWKARHGVTLNG